VYVVEGPVTTTVTMTGVGVCVRIGVRVTVTGGTGSGVTGLGVVGPGVTGPGVTGLGTTGVTGPGVTGSGVTGPCTTEHVWPYRTVVCVKDPSDVITIGIRVVIAGPRVHDLSMRDSVPEPGGESERRSHLGC